VCTEARASGFPLVAADTRSDDAAFDVARLLFGAPL
jgi:hypothetical protein